MGFVGIRALHNAVWDYIGLYRDFVGYVNVNMYIYIYNMNVWGLCRDYIPLFPTNHHAASLRGSEDVWCLAFRVKGLGFRA